MLLEFNTGERVEVVIEKADLILEQGGQILKRVEQFSAEIKSEISRAGDDVKDKVAEIIDRVQILFDDGAKAREQDLERQAALIQQIENQQSKFLFPLTYRTPLN